MDADVWATIEDGDLAALKRLIASGKVSVNGEGDEWPLHSAAWHGHLDMVRYLVEEAGADPRLRDDRGSSFLELAACSGRLEVVRYLIEERGMDPTEADPRVGLKGHEL